jgi:Flp pilus assembly protein TadB
MEQRIKQYRKYMEEQLKLLENLSNMTEESRETEAEIDTEAVQKADTESNRANGTDSHIEKKREYIKEKAEILKENHLTQIAFFQHERFIHLIVTVTFALLEVLALLIAMICPGISAFCLVLIILVLLIPYIRHYYILENETQKMYEQYDRLCRYGKEASFGLCFSVVKNS